MNLPDFLIKENRQPVQPDDKEMYSLMQEYRQVIGDDISTEPFYYFTQEWIDIFRNCVEKKITMWDYLGIKRNTEQY